MPIVAKLHRTYFGNTIMLRADCPVCRKRCLLDAESKCEGCGSFIVGERLIVERESECFRPNRKRPTRLRQAEILRDQDHRCYWCGRMFGWRAHHAASGDSRILRPHWDHFIPFAFTGSCDDLEFVASCWLCNAYKGDHFFDDEHQCRAHVRKKIARSGWALDDPDLEAPNDWRPAKAH